MSDANETIAFLGPEASYSHQAALLHRPSLPSTHLHPQHSISDVFTSVQNGSTTLGIVPFENSTNGSVVFTLDLFADLKGQFPDVRVVDEVFVGVHHCLVGHVGAVGESTSASSSAQNGDTTPTTRNGVNGAHRENGTAEAKFENVKKIYSHPQVWGQVHTFLNKYPALRRAEKLDVSSTSRAAQLVAQDTSGEAVAISSEMAGTAHNLAVLARNIEDDANNTTRFFVLKKSSPASDDSQHYEDGNESDGDTDEPPGQGYKTLITFTVPESTPGALAASLAVFGRHGLNLTSINSRPGGVAPWNYVFLIEVLGRREDGDPSGGGEILAALRELEGVCSGWRWRGSWRRRD